MITPPGIHSYRLYRTEAVPGKNGLRLWVPPPHKRYSRIWWHGTEGRVFLLHRQRFGLLVRPNPASSSNVKRTFPESLGRMFFGNRNCSVPDVPVVSMAAQGPPLQASFIVAAAPPPPRLNSYRESSTHCFIFLRLNTPLHLLPLDALTLASLSATHAASAAYRCIRCLCLSLALRQMRPLSPSPSLPGLLLPLSQTTPEFRSPSLLTALADVMYICFGSALPSPCSLYRVQIRLTFTRLIPVAFAASSVVRPSGRRKASPSGRRHRSPLDD